MTMETKKWLNVDSIAQYLGVSKRTIYQYVADRKIPHVKIPKSNQVRFNPEEIDDWMLQGKVETIDEALSK